MNMLTASHIHTCTMCTYSTAWRWCFITTSIVAEDFWDLCNFVHEDIVVSNKGDGGGTLKLPVFISNSPIMMKHAQIIQNSEDCPREREREQSLCYTETSEERVFHKIFACVSVTFAVLWI